MSERNKSFLNIIMKDRWVLIAGLAFLFTYGHYHFKKGTFNNLIKMVDQKVASPSAPTSASNTSPVAQPQGQWPTFNGTKTTSPSPSGILPTSNNQGQTQNLNQKITVSGAGFVKSLNRKASDYISISFDSSVGDTDNINSALMYANDTEVIKVYPGTYQYSSFGVEKRDITFVGVGKKENIIINFSKSEVLRSDKIQKLSFKNLTLTGSQTRIGVYRNKGSELNLEDVYIEVSDDGVLFNVHKNTRLKAVRLKGVGLDRSGGIFTVGNRSQLEIKDSHFSNLYSPLYLREGTKTTIENSIFKENNNGIRTYKRSDISIRNSTFERNDTAVSVGQEITLTSASNNFIDNQTAVRAGGPRAAINDQGSKFINNNTVFSLYRDVKLDLKNCELRKNRYVYFSSDHEYFGSDDTCVKSENKRVANKNYSKR